MARDIGRSTVNLGGLNLAGASVGTPRKPDGTTVNPVPYPSHLRSGTANRITLELPNIPVKAKDILKDGKSTAYTDPDKPATGKKKLENVVTNPLEDFASYTTLFTMACLSPEQFNDPNSYRDNSAVLENVIFSSAGRFDSQRTKTASGVPEYYIDDFEMRAKIAPNPKSGVTNAFAFEFDIYEPYSMGLLLQSLQTAAINSGYVGYLEAPYVLIMDFKGYTELGEIKSSIKSKFFTIRLKNVTFEVDEGGSHYKVEAKPFNDTAFSELYDIAFNDIKIVSGEKGNVEEILNSGETSLVKMLNASEEKLVNEKKIGIADIYEIQFPEKSNEFKRYNQNKSDPRGTFDPNARITSPTVDTRYVPSILKSSGKTTVDNETINIIGNASLGFSAASGGNFPFKKHDDVVDPETGKIRREQVVIDPKKRTFQFAQKQKLTSIIEQVILNSAYVKDALDPKNLTAQGYVKWFKIDVQIELLKMDPIVGDFAKKITYRVIPYYVHHSVFSNVNAMPVGYSEIQRKICKDYNFIYTGQNNDILDFKIELDALFYTAANSSAETDAGQVSDQNQKGTAEDLPTGTKSESGPALGSQLASTGRPRYKRSPSLLNKIKGGSGDRSSEQLVAEAFHDAFVNSQRNLVNVDLTILGDPYWIIDSGIGNYFAGVENETDLINFDGSVNYESGDVYIYLTFRTPIDINEKSGLYDFPTSESAFTGIYRITECISKISGGVFKQELRCLRMSAQPSDFADKNIEQELNADRNTVFATSFTEEQQARVTVSDPIVPSLLTNSAGAPSSSNATNIQNALTGGGNPFAGVQSNLTGGGNPFAGLPSAPGENSLDGGQRLLGGGQ